MTDLYIEVASRQLTIKFGTLSEEVKDKLSSTDLVSLELVPEKLLTSNSLSEILSHLKYKDT